MFALLVDLGWKSALIAGLALLANHLLRHRAPAERVALLRAALAALLMLPLLTLVVPELEVAVLPALDAPPLTGFAAAGAEGVDMAAGEAPAAISFDWLAALYLVGAAMLLLRLVVGVSTLWRWTHNAAPVRDPCWIAAMRGAGRLRRPVRLLVSPHVAAPMSWGVAPVWLLIGPGTEQRADQAEAVIAHELAHVRRFDWPVLMAAQLAALCFWFNPLVWLLTRELGRQTEMAADEDAIRHVTRADYAQALLTLGRGVAHPAACGMSVTRSALGQRIRGVLDADAARPASRLLCVAMLASAPLAAAPLAAMQLVHAAASAPSPREALARLPAAAVLADLPSVIPAARAAEVQPVPRPRAAPRRIAPTRAPRSAVTAEPKPSVLPELEGRISQGHAGHTPPPPQPPAPGTQAAAWREAIFEKRTVRVENRERNVAMRRARAAIRTGDADDRDLARAMTDAAKGLRVKAQDLEAVAADGSVVKEVRDAHARAAGSLRSQADKLDIDARRKLFGG
jgi:beta-lactamase regulating signal transducer with metallopeptidase domain